MYAIDFVWLHCCLVEVTLLDIYTHSSGSYLSSTQQTQSYECEQNILLFMENDDEDSNTDSFHKIIYSDLLGFLIRWAQNVLLQINSKDTQGSKLSLL